MNILIKLQLEDWEKFQLYIEKEISDSVKSWVNNFWLNVVFWGGFGFFSMSILRNAGGIHWTTFGLVSVFFILNFILFTFKQTKLKKAFSPSESGLLFVETQFIFNEEGIKTKAKDVEGKNSWSAVQRIERTEGMILIFLDTTLAYIFPENKLENPDELYIYINEQYKKI